jgi:hypothetical protein
MKIKLFLLLGLTLRFMFPLIAQENREILFIGNSYTYVNDLPATFKALAQSMGKSVLTDSYAPGGYTFQGHSSDASAIAKINSRNWDYVILQEQSQLPSFPPSQVTTECFPYARKLDSIITAHDSCTETVFFMTWGRKNGDASNCASWPPVCTFEGMQEQLRMNYLQMGIDNSATVAPAGMAWYKARLQSPAFDLWSSDESHPSVYGTYLTACVFYATLFHESPEGCPYISTISAADAGFLQYIAAITVFDSLDQWAAPGNKAYARFQPQINGPDVTFNNTSLNSLDWSWDFGDGQGSSLQSPTHTFANPGDYLVRLAARNQCLEDTVTDTITITSVGITSMEKEDGDFYLSPNPAKDYLSVYGEGSVPSGIAIINTIGQKMKEIKFPQDFPVQIDISSLPSGVYFIRMINAGRVQTLPFMKME